MNDMSAERRQLLEELQAVENEIKKQLNAQRPLWNFRLGPLRIENKEMTPMFIRKAFFVFNAFCFSAGFGMAFIGGTFTAIGASMIVGSLFSFGSFLAQFWAIATQNSFDLAHKVREADLENAGTLIKRWDNITQKIEALDQSNAGEAADT